MQALRQEGVQTAEGTSKLQDWNLECKDLESRRKTGEFENRNANVESKWKNYHIIDNNTEQGCGQGIPLLDPRNNSKSICELATYLYFCCCVDKS